MRFNLALVDAGIRPEDAAIILHTTNLPILRKVLPWLAEHRPDLFDAYQSLHSTTATATLRKRKFAASFVPSSPGEMLFVGLFRVSGAREMATIEIYSDPRFTELERDFGATDTSPTKNIAALSHQVRFDLDLVPELSDLRGRLTISSSSGRTYARLAERLDPQILAIHPEPLFAAPMPDWRDLVLTSAQIRLLPPSWRDRLAQWRGIYLIVDSADGGRYVGSAYGAENIAGRWEAHISGDRGVTAELGLRNTTGFCFSVLERVSPDMAPEEVIALETGWKRRLHTFDFGLNRN